MKITYEKIARAIYNKVKEEGLFDERDLLREWIRLFEDSKVNGWNRDKFLDEYIKIKEEQK